VSPAEWQAVRLSALVGAASVLLAVPPAALLAYWLVGARFRGKVLLEAFLLTPLVLPPVVTGLVLLEVFGASGPLGAPLAALGLEVPFTLRGAVLAAAVMAFPLAYRAARVAFEAVDGELVGIARTLGANRIDAFFSVSLPLARGGLLAACVLAFVRSIGEFGATMVLAGNVSGETRTLPLQVYTAFQMGDDRAVLHLSVVAVLLALAGLATIEVLGRRERVR